MNPTPTEIPPIPQTPSSPPIPPPPAGGTPKFPLFPILAGILLMILVATGTFFLGKSQNNQNASIPSTPSPLPSEALAKEGTPDPTDNWETYINTKYKYQFKYPSDFKIFDESADRIYINNNLPADPNCQGGGCFLGTPRLSIYFEHLNNPGEDELNLDDYATARSTSIQQEATEPGIIKKIQKFGLDVRYAEGVTQGYSHNYFMKPSPNLSFSISAVFPSKEDVPKYESIAEKILSTFKFIE